MMKMTSSVSHETSPLLQVQQVSKRFGTTIVLDQVSLSIPKGNVVSILGRSGSGKSTLLRCIAGLERVDHGQIVVAGQEITHLPTHQRQIGMMFQQFALFPHQTVAENIVFGLRMRGDSQESQHKRVKELLDLVGLQGYERRSIFELSGGEQQRVALARSLAPNPPLLLLDEPMSSLDQSLRERLMGEIRAILKAIDITALYITHDQHEAFAVADWLVLLENGKVVQEGVPEEVYHHPINRFAARFFGIQNLLPVIEVIPTRDGKSKQVKTAVGLFHVSHETQSHDFIAFPAESAEIVDKVDNPVDNLGNLLTGVVKARSFRGGYYEVIVEYEDGILLTWEVEWASAVGESITIRIPSQRILFVAS
jgi:ABC-type Fe3+/spermidine/putrescine transport system ATPase subunit